MKDPLVVFRNNLFTFGFTWLVLEVACFGLLPWLEFVEFEEIEAFFLPSVVTGVFGSVLAAFASSGFVSAKDTASANQKQFGRAVSQLLGLLGFAGIIFPFVFGLLLFAQSVRETDWENLFQDKPIF